MKLLLALVIFVGTALMGNVVYQPPTTPQSEEEIVYSQESKPIAPLSNALYDLVQDILDQTFDEAFFKKIWHVEETKYTGEYVDHWENGQLKIKAYFKEGKVDGHVHGWFPDGLEAFKAFYYENKKAGIHIAFYPEGGPRVIHDRIARIHCYDFDGKLDGEQLSNYHMSGLKSLVRYRHGVLNGHMCLYDDAGVCVKDRTYENGKLVKKEK